MNSLTYQAQPPCLAPVREHSTYARRCGECENCRRPKAFESDGEVSRDHHYVLARNTSTGEEAHFAIPKSVVPRMVDAIEACRAFLSAPWVQFDLDDRYYGGGEPQELIDSWSRDFLTDMAVSAATTS